MTPSRPSPRPRSAARPYHHGDLRQALVDAAIQILRKEGPDGLTLRAVARAAGVSQAAPYRHFKDRRALVAAVAEDGFRRLGSAMATKSSGPKKSSPRTAGEALRQLAVQYVKFAHAHPAEYRVMFGEELAPGKENPELRASSRAVFDLLSGGIAALQQRGIIRKGDPDTIAVGAWAMMHGLTMLSLDRHATVAGRSIDDLVAAVTDLLMNGMKNEPVAGAR
jgi:AcrR family transcriptional regulator